MSRAVIFDFFGTLTGPAPRGPAHDRVAAILGADRRAFAAALDRTYRDRIRGRYGDAVTALSRVAAELGLSVTPDQARAATAARMAALRADIRLRPDALGTLKALRERGFRLGLITDCPAEVADILPSLRIYPWLDTVVCSNAHGTAKPDRVLYAAACSALGVRPGDCRYVGDGGGHELTGARAFGMHAIRLAAPDLVDHPVFDADAEWDGPSVRRLYELV